ncbi:MAG: hypothetical protein Fur0022_40530 [Anaerolineales bacterium]
MASLNPALLQLRTLLLAQRTVRLLVRAAWTGLAGYLIGWGINDLYGTLPNAQTWTTLGGFLALPSIVTIFYTLPMSRLVWNLDRRFALREQLSTAWQTSQHPAQTRLSTLLLADAAALLPAQRARILRRGWFLSRDLLSLLVVLGLFFTVSTFTEANTPYPPISQHPPLALPPLAEAPTYQDIFPSGIPGLTQPPNTPAPSEPLSPDEATDLDDILSELGENLSENPETAPAGEALQQGDLAEAAAELERLADELDNLPAEARENAEDALRNAAQQAEQAGAEDLANALQEAADGMEAPESNNLQAAEALDHLADEFRQLEDQFAALGQAGDQEPTQDSQTPPQEGAGGSSAGTGSENEGQPEPLERLEGEGQTVEIEGDETPSGLLTPGEASGPPTTDGSGPIIASGGGSGKTDPIQSILVPYNFSWRWRDVVSKYFSPPQ